ncbi:MAG: DUF4924 family protein [Flavobacteriales bacterium]|nr:DUF4924 family protein [Flavobacteriales bacterium]
MRHIAEEKRKENIVEYLLFMWQMEDLLRSVGLDADKLKDTVLADIEDEKLKKTNELWFSKLAKEMDEQSLSVSGHLEETMEILNELQVLEQTLLTVLNDEVFKDIYSSTKPLLNEFKQKTDRIPKSDVEAALTAMYGMLTLKLAQKEISPETQAAFQKFRKYLSALARAYREMKEGSLPMNN